MNSDVFKKMFSENPNTEIEIKNVTLKDFVNMLDIIYPSNKPITSKK